MVFIYFRGINMEKKYNRAVLFFLISAVGMLVIEQYNPFLYHFLIEISTVFIGVLIFIIAINSRMYSERRLLLSVGVAYVYVSLFDFMHLLTYEGISFVPFDINMTTQFWLNARIIEAMSFVTIFALGVIRSRKINYPATHLFLLAYSAIMITLIYMDAFPPVYVGGKQTIVKIITEGVIIVLLITSLVLARQLDMKKDVRNVFIIAISLKILSEIMFMATIQQNTIHTAITHTFKYLSFGGIYFMFVNEIIKDPYRSVYQLFETRHQELTFQAERDSLTGIYNHSTTFSKIDQKIEELKGKEKITVIMIDIDDFKHVNDKYGHQKGDEVLFEFAQLILTCDLENKVVGRYGGDEFVVAGTNIKRETVDQQFTLVKHKLEELNRKIGFEITFSAGIAFYEDGDTTKDLIYKADIKMYEAKRLGKNQYVVW